MASNFPDLDPQGDDLHTLAEIASVTIPENARAMLAMAYRIGRVKGQQDELSRRLAEIAVERAKMP